ncbi:MAG: 2,3-bisphosphoglycerate-independent phosphoglycerate mutase [Thermodesulfobacteriota bacterium]
MTTATTPVLLAILDGWGYGEPSATNAIHLANTPNMDRWQREYPFTTLIAHNGAVGLPEGQMGNSEVGHLNIGAGRIVYQDFTRINREIVTGSFRQNPVLSAAMGKVAAAGGSLHLLGLVSDGGVHSHINHLVALLEMAAGIGLREVFVHAFMDGRDTPPKSGAGYMAQLQEAMDRIGTGRVATVCGRYYAMDRDNRWGRVRLAWEALVDGTAEFTATGPVAAVEAAYGRGETDEFIKPTVIAGNGRPLATIDDHDVVIFFNFRADRARQLTHALTDAAFNEFPCRRRPQLAELVTFTSYDKHFDLPVAFPPQSLTRILGEEISRHGLRQLRIAETEKYAHVTYFFNGGREDPLPLEDRVLIPSPKEVATYDQKPEMSAFAVTEELLGLLEGNPYGLVVLNFANGDMVGHSGNLAAAIKACEAVDQCLGRIVEKFTAQGGVVLITADHGNAEIMVDPVTGGPFTAHSSNPVPFLMVGNGVQGWRLRDDGTLTNIAPTILDLMGLPVPAEMESRSLLVKGEV